MKLKNWIITLFAAIFCLVPLTVSAHSAVLVDTAGIVESSDFAKIDDALFEVHDEYDVDVWVHTTDTLNGYSIFDYTDLWYESHKTSDNGIVLVVCSTTREYQIMTSGSCISTFTDAGLDYMEQRIVPKMSKGDYAGAFKTFAALCDDYLKQDAKGAPYDASRLPKEPFNVVKSILISLVVGLVVGAVAVLMLFANLKSVHQQHGAKDYKKPNSFHLDSQRNMYLYRKVERTRKEQNTTQRNGGSSTQVGSSGNVRGGSGGSF